MQTKQKIESNSIVSREPGFITSEIDGETVMMSVEQGNYFGLDSVGTRIWDGIKSPTKVCELINSLVEEFEVELSTCEKDVLEFLQRLSEKQIIKVQ